jgi:hypothetical protein
VCRRAQCRAELRKFPERYRWAKTGERPPRSAHSTGLKTGSKSGRALRKVAGRDLPEINLRIPLDPERVSRLDRDHADYFEARKKAKRAAARKALIKRHHPPVNIVGGYKFPDAPAVDLSPIESAQWATASRWVPAGAGADVPDIPEFLKRATAAAPPIAAAEEPPPCPAAAPIKIGTL